MSLTDSIEITRRVCPIIFLLDTSGSMEGQPIGAVDAAIEGVIPLLGDMNEGGSDAEIKISILTFSNGIEWVTGDHLIAPEEYTHRKLQAHGLTDMGAAFLALNQKLSRRTGFMRHASGSVAPVIFLLSDGEPSDDYRSALHLLQQNNWFRISGKVAVGYGDDCNFDVLLEFTGSKETVIRADTPEDLRKMIRFVAITSSKVASTSHAIDPDASSEEVAKPDDNTGRIAKELCDTGAGIIKYPDDEQQDEAISLDEIQNAPMSSNSADEDFE